MIVNLDKKGSNFGFKRFKTNIMIIISAKTTLNKRAVRAYH